MPKNKPPAPWNPDEYNANFLSHPEQGRYLSLRRKTSPSEEEKAEALKLLRKAEENRRCLSRYEFARPNLDRAAAELQKDPDNPVVQREYLRTIVVPCYPNFSQVEFELVAKGMHKPWAYMAARQGLEGVLYVMNNTVVWEVIEDLDRRLAFLFNLQEMLQPFRKLKAGDTIDLNKAFEFSATGRGGRSKEQLDLTLLDWGEPCFDLHLLQMAGVKITPAKNRVAAVHGKTPESLEKAYKDWSQHPVRKEVSRRGDDRARETLNRSNFQVLLGTAFPAPLATPRPHRPA